jgi:hypothetical protein
MNEYQVGEKKMKQNEIYRRLKAVWFENYRRKFAEKLCNE